jgi:hypothetical protein
MRKFVLALACALALLCLSQRASAGCCFSFSCGFECSWQCGGCQPCCFQPWCGPVDCGGQAPYADPYLASYAPAADGGWMAPSAYPVVNGGTYAPAPAAAANFQPVGYTYGQGSYGALQPGLSPQVPYYWYGR